MATLIKTLKQGENKIAPRTKASAVALNDGTSVEAKIGQMTTFANLTITMVGSRGGTPTGNTVLVYKNISGGSRVLVATVVYGTVPVSLELPRGFTYVVEGSVTVDNFYRPTTQTVVLDGDKTAQIEYWEVGKPTNMQEVHWLIELGKAAEVMEVGDTIPVQWTRTNGTVYTANATVAEVGHKYISHATGTEVDGVRFQFLKGFPDAPQFDAAEREKATEVQALADTYYYGTNDNSTFTLLDYTAGQTIDYSAYTYIYHNSFRDTTTNILKYGNNLLQYSAELQWLNSAEPKATNVGVDGWWRSTHFGDTAPSQATTINGFMRGFSQEDFLQYVLDEDFKIGQNTVTADGSLVTLHAKFRNPMIVEMYGVPQTQGEGDNRYWEVWKQLCNNSAVDPISAPSNGSCGARRIMNLENTSFSTAFLSSCYRANSYDVWSAYYAAGQLNIGTAYASVRSAPAFVIV